MSQKPVKNIIFDLGGVILNIDYKKTENAFRELGVSDFDRIYSQSRQTKLFDRFETGKISPEEFIDELRGLAQIQADDEQVINAWNAMLLDLPKSRLKLIESLKNDYRVLLFSNTNAIHYKAFQKLVREEYHPEGLSPFFHKVYFSHEVGLRKPNTAAFEYVLNENQLQAEETIFIDDSEQHIEGAQKTGIRAYHKKEGECITELVPGILTELNKHSIG